MNRLRSNWVFALLLVVSVGAIYISGQRVFDSRRSLGWPSVVGTVLRSEIETNDSSDAVSYYPNIQYTYEVGGRRYQSNEIAFGAVAYGGGGGREGESEAQSWVERYPTGANITVIYDPKNPNTSILVRDESHAHFSLLATILTCLMAFVLLSWARVSHRTSE